MSVPSYLIEAHESFRSQVESSLNELLTTSGARISPAEAVERVVNAGSDYVGQSNSISRSAEATESVESEYQTYPESTPGVPELLWEVWDTVLDKVHTSPTQEDAHHDHIGLVVDFVGGLKSLENPAEQEWLIGGQRTEWKNLPLLGPSVRDVYNGPFSIRVHEGQSWQTASGQQAVAGNASSSSSSEDDPISQIASERHEWLALQSFISRLWRDCTCHDYSLYAIWAIRAALEDWPASPPSLDETPDSFETSPAYLALQVEAASIWICNTASLMYASTDIWGKNGNPNWPTNAGTPGEGGRRWTGVDGYDAEHKRWQLWKEVLREVIEWYNVESAKGHMQGWTVKDAATKALQAMDEVDGSS